MTSAYAAESNRQNAQKSTGPRSPEGKERTRCNAVKHGATARLLVLPGEPSEEIDRQREAWLASRASDDPIERALVERAFEAWQQLGRTLRFQQAGIEKRMLEADLVEQQQASDAVLELGNRLFRDRNGPYQCYPNRRPGSRQPPTSGEEMPGDPDQPARLVLRLESTAAGCRWLLARWNELAEVLEAGNGWTSPDRFRAIRLLGKQPLDAMVDREVLRIFLACHVLCPPSSKSPFQDLLRELDESPGDPNPILRPVLRQLTIEPYTPKDSAEAHLLLVSLVNRAASRLLVLLEDREARERETAAGAADRQAFDPGHDGELMRRYEMGCDRAFHRALERLRLLRKDAARGRDARTSASETERVDGGNCSTELAEETSAESLVSSTLSTLERPLPETESGDPLPTPADDDIEPMMGDGQKPRNEAVAAFIGRNDSAGKPSDRVGAAPGNGQKLRNEAVAASTGRADSAGQAVASAPAVLPREPPDCPRPRSTRPPMFVGQEKASRERQVESRDAPGRECLVAADFVRHSQLDDP
jgi:hypothetical protein